MTLESQDRERQESVSSSEDDFPSGTPDERELFLSWLRYLRGAVVRKAAGLGDEDARWTPDGALLSLLGIVNHLTHVEWRWVGGGMRRPEGSPRGVELLAGTVLP